MSLIIATGTNLGQREKNLQAAKDKLKEHFNFISESRIYQSPAVDYLNQPDFYNQVLEFEAPPHQSAEKIMKTLLEIELELGRIRDIPRGPRIIDLDILFIGIKSHESKDVTLPHPRLFGRSFVVLPLKELPYFSVLEKHFDFPPKFDNIAIPIDL